MSLSNLPVPILAHKQTALIDSGTLQAPGGWSSRALYPGESGARNWIAVVREPSYPLRDPDKLDLRKNRLAAIDGLAVATFVSLGPGDGTPDVPLVTSLQRWITSGSLGQRTGRLKYIPVEISRNLLNTALDTIQPLADVPVGILCDFEEHQDFLRAALNRHATPPILFSFLGGTLGNLDKGEELFFQGLRQLMRKSGALLVDVPLAGPGWCAADEPRLRAEAYTPAFQRFLIEGIYRRNVHRSDNLREEGEPISFGDRIGLSHHHDSGTGAEVITLADRLSGQAVLTFRRYRWKPILCWFEDQGFVIRSAGSSITSDRDLFGMGVVLLVLS